jgi:hypothetical protein
MGVDEHVFLLQEWSLPQPISREWIIQIEISAARAWMPHPGMT